LNYENCPPLRVLEADPAWQLGDSLPGKGRGASKHYSTLSMFELQRFPLPPLLPDCLLFLWRVSAMPEEGLRVIRAWGFVPKSEMVWIKTTKTGKRHMGMGRYVRLGHEVCHIAARGKARDLILDHSVLSHFEAPVGEHSEKPQAFYDRVQQLIGGPYGSLFARQHRPGWHCFGDEVDGRKERDAR